MVDPMGADDTQVLAFNVTVGSQNLTTTQILNVPDSVVKTAVSVTM